MAVKENEKNKNGQIEKLIGLLMSDHDLQSDLLESLQAWLTDNDEAAAEKDIILESNFDRIVETLDSKEYALESWPELARKLGMEPWPERKAYTSRERGAGGRASRKSKLQMIFIRYVAVAIICMAIPALMLLMQRIPANRGVTDIVSAGEPLVATTVSDTATLWFPDGSRALMRSNSTISYACDFAENRHAVIDGEAFFFILHDEHRPFVVEGRDVKVTVMGTEFNMRAFDAESHAEVALIAGTVTVDSPGGKATLKPKERATIDRANKNLEVKTLNDGELLRARGANLELNGVTLEKAFAMIGGYFGIAIDAPARLPAIDGIVLVLEYDASPEDAMFLLQAVSPVFDYRMGDSSVSITVR